jgi:HSP20 family molecular chaperone IbpA
LVKPDKAEATFRNGELSLVLPKAEEVKPHSIKIKTVS